MPGLKVAQAETIYKLTTGRERFLVTTDGGYRWSDFNENDERDDFEKVGGKPIASPLAAGGCVNDDERLPLVLARIREAGNRTVTVEDITKKGQFENWSLRSWRDKGEAGS